MLSRVLFVARHFHHKLPRSNSGDLINQDDGTIIHTFLNVGCLRRLSQMPEGQLILCVESLSGVWDYHKFRLELKPVSGLNRWAPCGLRTLAQSFDEIERGGSYVAACG